MKIKTKVAVSVMLCLALTVPVSAMGSNAKKLDHGPLVKAVDTNKDGRMSLKEWQSAGLPMSSFNGLNKNGYVTEEIMLAGDAPDGIDINGDGKLELKEFLEFDKVMSAKMAAGVGPPAKFDNRPKISEGEAAYAMWQVQNVMSKHAYYHAAGMHLEELADIWVDENGPNADTATFASPAWIMHGIVGVKKFYGQGNQDNKVRELEEISKLYPEIKNIPENLGVGHEYAMHTNTTPIIEIAGDGKTAKGVWYSPGIGLNARINGKNVSYGGTFFWEKYGGDFIKENGVWKIWHLQMWYDWTPSFPTSMTGSIGRGMGGGPPAADQGGAPAGDQGGPPAGGPPGGPGAGGDQASAGAIEAGERMQGQADVSTAKPGDMTENPHNNYQNYSVKRVPTIEPRFPEPYYTFIETFSY